MSEEQGTKLTRLTDDLVQRARADVQRRMREQLVNSIAATVDAVVAQMMQDLEIAIESDLTVSVKIKK